MKSYRRQHKFYEHPDKNTIELLSKYDSNITNDHLIEFFLYFPDKFSVISAAKGIRTLDFEVVIYSPRDNDQWLCFATKKIVPLTVNLLNIRHCFEKIAKEFNGTYDGWGTLVD